MSIGVGYTIGDLNSNSWPKFEEFFNKYNGVQNSCWCVYYHKKTPSPRIKKSEKADYNHNLKRKLVEEGKSRAVLVYKEGKVVASCQYGTFDELPRIQNASRYEGLVMKNESQNAWRITCFFVDTAHRHKGLVKLALDGVLDRIARSGGGLVEAYPVTKRNTVEIWFGSVNMYLERGFEVISKFGNSNVLVRRFVEPIDD
ncbi:MAG: GNAT family N-acetyltransferase [Candidatus Thermoplasmatota archaeon]|nr:GNAT family N-acetyltransferase [Candidatus Thermoplasmatota archaeon]